MSHYDSWGSRSCFYGKELRRLQEVEQILNLRNGELAVEFIPKKHNDVLSLGKILGGRIRSFFGQEGKCRWEKEGTSFLWDEFNSLLHIQGTMFDERRTKVFGINFYKEMEDPFELEDVIQACTSFEKGDVEHLCKIILAISNAAMNQTLEEYPSLLE